MNKLLAAFILPLVLLVCYLGVRSLVEKNNAFENKESYDQLNFLTGMCAWLAKTCIHSFVDRTVLGYSVEWLLTAAVTRGLIWTGERLMNATYGPKSKGYEKV